MSSETAKTTKSEDDWYLACSDDEVYVESGCAKGHIGCRWEPDVSVAVELFERIEKEGVLPLQWKCLQGMRRPSGSDDDEEVEDTNDPAIVSKDVSSSNNNNNNNNVGNNFDFDDEEDDNNGNVNASHALTSKTPLAQTGRRNRPELKGSARKKTTSFDGVISSMKRHRQMDKVSKREKAGTKEPLSGPNPSGFQMNPNGMPSQMSSENKVPGHFGGQSLGTMNQNSQNPSMTPLGMAPSSVHSLQNVNQSIVTSVQHCSGAQTQLMNVASTSSNIVSAPQQTAMMNPTMHMNQGVRAQGQQPTAQMNVVHQQGQGHMIRGPLRVIPSSTPQFQTVAVNNQPMGSKPPQGSQFIQINPQQRRQPIFVQQQTSLDGSQQTQYFQAIHSQPARPQYQQVIIQNQQPMQVIPMQQPQQLIFQTDQQQQPQHEQHVGQFVQTAGHTFVRAATQPTPGFQTTNYTTDSGPPVN